MLQPFFISLSLTLPVQEISWTTPFFLQQPRREDVANMNGSDGPLGRIAGSTWNFTSIQARQGRRCALRGNLGAGPG